MLPRHSNFENAAQAISEIPVLYTPMNKDVPLIYEFDGYLFNEINRTFFYHGVEIRLTKRNFDVLQLLIEKNGTVVSKTEFFERVWADTFVEDGNLAVSITALRKIFETHSNSAFIETVPRRGYKFTASVKKIYEDEPETNPTETETKSEPKSEPKLAKPAKLSRFSYKRTLKKAFLVLSIGMFLAIIGGGTAFYYNNNKKSEEKKSTIKKIVIFPFENITRIQEVDYLSLAFADSLNYSLFMFPNVTVTSTSQIKQYFNKSYDPIEEGRKLGVGAVVTGSYHKSADKLTVNVVVTDITVKNPVGQHEEFTKTTDDLTDLQGSVVRFIITRLSLNLSPKEFTALKKQQTQNLNAYELYLRAANFFANDKPEDAINYYYQSLAADPNFNAAWEGLASVYISQGNAYGCGEVCANKAVEILNNLKEKDPENDQVSINLAQLLIEFNQTEKAVSILKEITVREPKNYFAYNGLNYAYRFGGLLDESTLMYEKGKEDDNYTVFEKGFWFYNNARLYQGDYTGFIATLQDDDNSYISRFYQGLSYYYLKDNEKAKKLFNEVYQQNPNAMITQFGKIYSYHIDNEKAKGLEMLDKIYKNIKVNKVYDGEMIYKAAQAFAVYDQKQTALELFDLSVEKGFFCYPYFASDSLMKNIKNEPNFQITLDKARKRHEAFKQSNY